MDEPGLNARPASDREPVVGPRFHEALAFAAQLHEGQRRKGKETPYLSHVLGVAALVLESGGDEDQAVAALLHDGPEDAGGRETLADIQRRFGDRVAGIVDACTDAYGEPKPAWLARKTAFLDRLPGVSNEAVPVILADKLHNARCILADHHDVGASVWDRFKADPEAVVSYYGRVADALAGRGGALGHELQVAVGRLQMLVE
jgi:(p)ppGpp synthase/HD superfamily hydrolase